MAHSSAIRASEEYWENFMMGTITSDGNGDQMGFVGGSAYLPPRSFDQVMLQNPSQQLPDTFNRNTSFGNEMSQGRSWFLETSAAGYGGPFDANGGDEMQNNPAGEFNFSGDYNYFHASKPSSIFQDDFSRFYAGVQAREASQAQQTPSDENSDFARNKISATEPTSFNDFYIAGEEKPTENKVKRRKERSVETGPYPKILEKIKANTSAVSYSPNQHPSLRKRLRREEPQPNTGIENKAVSRAAPRPRPSGEPKAKTTKENRVTIPAPHQTPIQIAGQGRVKEIDEAAVRWDRLRAWRDDPLRSFYRFQHGYDRKGKERMEAWLESNSDLMKVQFVKFVRMYANEGGLESVKEIYAKYKIIELSLEGEATTETLTQGNSTTIDALQENPGTTGEGARNIESKIPVAQSNFLENSLDIDNNSDYDRIPSSNPILHFRMLQTGCSEIPRTPEDLEKQLDEAWDWMRLQPMEIYNKYRLFTGSTESLV